MSEEGGTARRKRTHHNRLVGGRARAKGAQEAALGTVPREMLWVFAKHELTQRYFTPEQWFMLRARYVPGPCCDGACPEHWVKNSSVAVGQITGYTNRSKEAREIEGDAVRMVGRLVFGPEFNYGWGGRRPWLEEVIAKWERIRDGSGESLDVEERRLLRQSNRAKKGRSGRTMDEADAGFWQDADPDPADYYRDRYGTVRSLAKRWSEYGGSSWKQSDAARAATEAAFEREIDGIEDGDDSE